MRIISFYKDSMHKSKLEFISVNVSLCRAKQQNLEERQADVEYELRCLLNKPGGSDHNVFRRHGIQPATSMCLWCLTLVTNTCANALYTYITKIITITTIIIAKILICLSIEYKINTSHLLTSSHCTKIRYKISWMWAMSSCPWHLFYRIKLLIKSKLNE